jgi:hypothetical protein
LPSVHNPKENLSCDFGSYPFPLFIPPPCLSLLAYL